MFVGLGGPGRIRTSDTRFRKPLLYPLSYGAVDGSGYVLLPSSRRVASAAHPQETVTPIPPWP
jgi:hypothetical protein